MLARHSWGQPIMDKLCTMSMPVPLGELVDVSVFHPLRNESELVFTHRHSRQWQEVRMPEVLPSNALSTESLRSIRSVAHPEYEIHATGDVHTYNLHCNSTSPISALRYVGKTPDSTFAGPLEKSRISMDFGITRRRLHVLHLQSLLNSFSRSRSGAVWSSGAAAHISLRIGGRVEGKRSCLIHLVNTSLDF